MGHSASAGNASKANAMGVVLCLFCYFFFVQTEREKGSDTHDSSVRKPHTDTQSLASHTGSRGPRGGGTRLEDEDATAPVMPCRAPSSANPNRMELLSRHEIKDRAAGVVFLAPPSAGPHGVPHGVPRAVRVPHGHCQSSSLLDRKSNQTARFSVADLDKPSQHSLDLLRTSNPL